MTGGRELRDKSAPFYIDNDNALSALLKGAAKPPDIHAAAGLIWRRVRDLRIAPRFERVQSIRNIADLPTRKRTRGYKHNGQGLLGAIDSCARS